MATVRDRLQSPRWALSLLLVTLLGSSVAEASKRGARRARALYKKANVHFNLGEYDRAAELYGAAYKAKPLPGFLFNIGQCHYNRGEHETALRFYQRYLLEQPDAPNRADVEAQIVSAEEAIAKRKKREEQAASAPASAPAPPPETQPATPPPPPPPGPSRGARILLWSGVAATVALLATGAITRGVALDMSTEFKDDATPLRRQLELKDSGETLTAVSSVTLVAGAVLAVGTVAYYLIGFRERAPRVGVAPAPGGALVSAGLVF